MSAPTDQSNTAAADAGVTEPATFVFADIAGFTALTEAHGDEQAAELVAEFCRAVQSELPASGGSQVYFGAAVNLAARVSGQAVGGEVLLTAHTAALAGE